VLKSLPDDFPGAIITMLHLAASPVFHFPRWLGQFGNLPVAVIENGTRLHDGHVYVAPPGTLVSVEKTRLRLHTEIPQRHHHCIDTLFTTAAASFKNRSIGVILTGGGTDGTQGLAAVYEAGGQAIVQNPKDAECGGMPRNAMKAVPVQYCLNLADIGDAVDLLARANARLESGLVASVRFLKRRARVVRRMFEDSTHNERTRRFLEKELRRLATETEDLKDLVKIEHNTG
jgi:two-component system chemotaxis response regulator CheB